jgi:hypothetical protein
MEKALVGTSSETAGARRRTVLALLAGMALLLGSALFSPAAQARPLTVCCFRVTVEVSGTARAIYTRVDKTDSQGVYEYRWEGTAYGLAHLQGSALRTDRGVEAGYLLEENQVMDARCCGYPDVPRDRHDPGCPGAVPGVQGIQSGRLALGKTRYSFPVIGLANGGMAFGRPLESLELNCGSLATETLFDLQAGNHAWQAPRQFFFNSSVRGLSARKLAMRRSQAVTCVEQSRRSANPRMTSSGFSAVSVKIVPFPASDLKHQQRRLAGFLGKFIDWDRRPTAKLAYQFFAGKHTPGNGCHPG